MLNERMMFRLESRNAKACESMNAPERISKFRAEMMGPVVVLFTASASEAHDLALLLARLHSGHPDVIALRGSKHGFHLTLISVSLWPSFFTNFIVVSLALSDPKKIELSITNLTPVIAIRWSRYHDSLRPLP